MATRHYDRYQITRVTLTVPKQYDTVLSRLQSSIKRFDGSALAAFGKDNSITLETFRASIRSMLGPHEFMQFGFLEHGKWTGLYGEHVGLKCARIILGNPEIAITMIRHDYQAGLWVPVEALLIEREDGQGTDIVYVKPSTYIVRDPNNDELKKAAEILDEKLEKLWDFVVEE